MHLRSNYCRVFAPLILTVALAGCAGSDFDASAWFSKPLNMFSNNLNYSYAQLGEAKQDRPLTAADFVDANGACPQFAPQQPPPTQSAPGPDGSAAAASEAASALAGGVGIGMSECDVVTREGAPAAVNIGRNPNGDRSAILTFQSGPQPGVYRFVAGRLTEMDRVEAPPAPEPPKKQPVKKRKPAKTKKPPKKDDNG